DSFLTAAVHKYSIKHEKPGYVYITGFLLFAPHIMYCLRILTSSGPSRGLFGIVQALEQVVESARRSVGGIDWPSMYWPGCALRLLPIRGFRHLRVQQPIAEHSAHFRQAIFMLGRCCTNPIHYNGGGLTFGSVLPLEIVQSTERAFGSSNRE